ncbi:hypothetical protein [Bdellovibrio sp. HCB337]|uniref:hypothetical protein n=1 Tax=Bdellovibrio sp. HCB337 TaxID=3394358 RepID=UPI0039A4C58A
MRFLVLLFTSLMISSSVFAEALIDLGFTYSADTLNADAESSSTQYFYNANFLFNIDRKMQWTVGWTVLGISQTGSVDSTNTTYSSFDIGPALRWNIDKNGIFSTTVAYGYIAKGTYTSGSTNETWEGTSLFGQFSFQAPIRDDKFYIGVSLNYYAATYATKTVSGVESSTDATKSWIFPMISFTWRP